MADLWVTGWKLSEFAGPLGDAAHAEETLGQVFVGTSATLRPDARMMRFRVSDDDDRLHGSYRETGDFATLAEDLDIDGAVFPAIHSHIEAEFQLQTVDLPPITFLVGRVGSGPVGSGRNLVVFADAALDPGRTYTFAGSGTCASIRHDAICFAAGTLIDTPTGAVAVESLGTGDIVLTRDSGPRAIVWSGSRRLSARDLRIAPRLAPVRLRAGSLGDGVPERDLVVSPQHHLSIDGWRAQECFNEQSVLAPARALCNDQNVTIDPAREGITYCHLLLEGHELVRANGQWAETLLAGPQAMAALQPEQVSEIDWISPGLMTAADQPARPILTVAEARSLRI